MQGRMEGQGCLAMQGMTSGRPAAAPEAYALPKGCWLVEGGPWWGMTT